MASKKPAAEQPQSNSTRGRKPLEAAPAPGPVLDAELLDARRSDLVVMGEHHAAIVDQFGDGLPWHPEHYEAAIQRELRQGCEAFLRAGSYLIVVRECAAHGEWGGMLRRLGIGDEQARRMMEASRRVAALSNPSTSRDLIQATKTQGKLVELLSLPEDQFNELATTGETDGLSLDDVEGMTVRELRAAVREARADLEAKDERVAKLSGDLEKEREKTAKAKRKWKAATPNDQMDILLQELEAAANHIRLGIAAGSEQVGLCGAVIQVMEHAHANDIDVDAEVAGVIAGLINDLRRVRDHDMVGVPLLQDKRYGEWQMQEE